MASEDATPEDWAPNEDERIVYLEVRDAGELLGIVTLIPQNAVCYEIHAALLPIAWGPRSAEALRGAIAWMFERSPARRIVASIPAYNRLAIALGKRAGMQQYGVNVASFERGGRLHDQILLGLSKPCPHS
jgi:RimJ/RimL family protein N-acetyltransferase